MARAQILFLIAIALVGCHHESQLAPRKSQTFEELSRKYAAMPLDDLSLQDDTNFQALNAATKEMWAKFPDRREAWMRPWLNTAKGDLTRKSLMLGLLEDADWQKDLSDSQRKKLENLIADEISIERTNLIQRACVVVVKHKLRGAIPALKKASVRRKEGSYNKKVIDDAIAKLSAIK